MLGDSSTLHRLTIFQVLSLLIFLPDQRSISLTEDTHCHADTLHIPLNLHSQPGRQRPIFFQMHQLSVELQFQVHRFLLTTACYLLDKPHTMWE
jgi:hypothetical protein